MLKEIPKDTFDAMGFAERLDLCSRSVLLLGRQRPGMHYILAMLAPFDVNSWNTSYACCGVYLFYTTSFGFDPWEFSR